MSEALKLLSRQKRRRGLLAKRRGDELEERVAQLLRNRGMWMVRTSGEAEARHEPVLLFPLLLFFFCAVQKKAVACD